mgnify:CR=1
MRRGRHNPLISPKKLFIGRLTDPGRVVKCSKRSIARASWQRPRKIYRIHQWWQRSLSKETNTEMLWIKRWEFENAGSTSFQE